MNWNGNEKGKMRNIALEHKGEAVKVGFGMPSFSCKCIKKGLENGKFNKDTFMIVVEYNAEYIKPIHNFMRKHFNDYYIHKGSIETLELDKVLDGKKIDYAFFDFCGNLTQQIAYWLYRYTDCFEIDAKLIFTFYAKIRKDLFPKLIWKHTDNQILPKVADKLRYTVHNLLDNIYNGNLVKNIQFDCQTLYLAFEKKEINFDYIYRYKDSSDMVLIGCNMSGEPNGRNDFYDFMDKHNEDWEYASQPIRRGKQKKSKVKNNVKQNLIDKLHITCFKDLEKVGVKAWITRIANQNGTSPARVMAGLKRCLTVRHKAA